MSVAFKLEVKAIIDDVISCIDQHHATAADKKPAAYTRQTYAQDEDDGKSQPQQGDPGR